MMDLLGTTSWMEFHHQFLVQASMVFYTLLYNVRNLPDRALTGPGLQLDEHANYSVDVIQCFQVICHVPLTHLIPHWILMRTYKCGVNVSPAPTCTT